MVVYVVRHAWAEPRGADYPDDDQRPLTGKGRKRFARMMEALAACGFEPAHVATSPLVRCRQTADILAAAVVGHPEVTELDDLAPGARLAPLLGWTADRAGGDVVWVGHAPDVSHLAAGLIGGGAIDFSKGAVASVEFEDELAPGRGELKWLVTAAMLEG